MNSHADFRAMKTFVEATDKALQLGTRGTELRHFQPGTTSRICGSVGEKRKDFQFRLRFEGRHRVFKGRSQEAAERSCSTRLGYLHQPPSVSANSGRIWQGRREKSGAFSRLAAENGGSIDRGPVATVTCWKHRQRHSRWNSELRKDSATNTEAINFVVRYIGFATRYRLTP
ncbi:hypothetical protein PoB_000339100 [Plakobranchus ocellatus]|uniref:Uncharacterized protein n=1 Tax=Plakobranchus ocellatus TaxID=259542 RepID=A0AAV3Y372_9GAST|nr:hypothetical protein PoB_000339100 [Plakobranchus ocellatus]